MGLTQNLARDLYRIQKLSEKDKIALRLLIVDYFAASYAGYTQNRTFNSAVEKIILSQGGTGESYVFMQKKKLPSQNAAYMNALYAHGAELDDGNKKAMGHIGAHVISAVFAQAETLKSTQDDVLLALATGYEAYIRISSAAQPGMVNRGFHSTGMAGALACAAACARLYHFHAEGIEDAIALSTTMASGLLTYGDSRPAIKPLNPAKAAEVGGYSAMLVNNGVSGPLEALEGQNGWFRAVTDSIDESMLAGAEDGHLLLHDCYFKLYPSCRHTHCGIEAAINLYSKVNGKRINKVEVNIYPNAIKLAGQIQFPKDQDETKFSIHYTLACALLNGQYGIFDMNSLRTTPEVIDTINKIVLIPEEQMEDRAKGIRGTRVKVILDDGSVEEDMILVPKGDPEKPLSSDDVKIKLKTCASGLENEEKLDLLISRIEKLGGQSTFIHPMLAIRG